MTSFHLFPTEQRWWSFADYQAVLDVMAETEARFVIEFGPGSSTLALLEGGASRIDTCESDPTWAQTYRPRLERVFPNVYGFVRIHEYTYEWPVPLTIPELDGRHFDLALIDGPRCTEHRPLAIRYCLDRCRVVLVPTEDEGRVESSYLRPILMDLGTEYGFAVEFRNTGPAAGGFAVMRRVP